MYGTTLSAGIPLTHVDHGKHYVVCSAHDPDGIDFHAFNGIDTCVFLMVGRSLPVVCERLTRDAGKRADAPAAVVKSGRTPQEEVFMCVVLYKRFSPVHRFQHLIASLFN